MKSTRQTHSGGSFIHRGKLKHYTEKKIASDYRFAVTRVIVETCTGFRMFSVAFPAGTTLYNYINSDWRMERLESVTFEFTVINEPQKVVEYKAFDENERFGGWIGDTPEPGNSNFAGLEARPYLNIAGCR